MIIHFDSGRIRHKSTYMIAPLLNDLEPDAEIDNNINEIGSCIRNQADSENKDDGIGFAVLRQNVCYNQNM